MSILPIPRLTKRPVKAHADQPQASDSRPGTTPNAPVDRESLAQRDVDMGGKVAIATQGLHPRLYFIRHGQTEWSLSGQHTGRTDLPLTARGEDEARELGLCLRDVPFAGVLASPRQRARRTCELVGLGPRAEIEADLAEWDYGEYEGLRSVNIRKGRPEWNVFGDGCPGGEMPAQVSDRADRLIARLRALDGNIALLSHGQFEYVLAARWIGLPVVEGQHFMLGTASLSMLGYEPSHPDVPVIALWNAAPHATLDSLSCPRVGDTRPMKQRAMEHRENEGGGDSSEQHNQLRQ